MKSIAAQAPLPQHLSATTDLAGLLWERCVQRDRRSGWRQG
jgi:hypothetical protein